MATAQSDLLRSTVSMLRSVLLSAPRGVRARNLEGEYRGITGKIIPYRELGYKSLKDFMNTLQDVARLSTAEGEPVYYGVADSTTAHIAKMVAKQKKPKKKSQPLYNSSRGNQRYSRGGGYYKGQRQHYSSQHYSSYLRNDYSRASTASSTVSQAAAQPERVVHMVEGNARTFGGGGGAKTGNSAGGGGAKTITSAGGGGAYATKAWKDAALKVDIMGYVSNMELKNVELVQLSGHVQNGPEEHSYKGMKFLRTLLCSSPELIVGKGQSVMCHFFFSDWNYQQHQGPWSLKRGQKVIFYGKPWPRSSAKVKESMALKVLYYDVITDRSLVGDSVTKHDNSSTTKKNTTDISYKKSDVPSPKKSPIARPAINDEELEERIYEIVISESSAGLYYDRTKVLYSKKYGHEFSDDKVAKMKSLRIEEPVPAYKILYPLKRPVSSQPATESNESQQLITPQATAVTVTAEKDELTKVTNELPPAVLPKAGEHLKILVTHVEEGPELFYVHICHNETIEGLQYLEKMTADLNKDSEVLTDGSVGQYCAALYKDDSWNRAVITETKLVKGSSKGSKMTSHIIQYVDYGSVASVMADQLRKLPTDYWKVPIQAIPCMLSLDEDDDYASKEAMHEHFNKHVLDKIFFIDIKSVSDEEMLIVDMFQEENGISVASQLQDLLSPEKPSLPECVQPAFDSDEEICCMDVFITLVESPASFYVQFIGEEFYDKLAAMETALEQYFTKHRPVTLKSYEVNNLTLYIDDEQYYLRALLLYVESNDHVRIQLVDYGHTMSVSKDRLFTLPNKFWKLPFQGRQCFLYECADFVDTQPVSEEFTAMAEEKQLVALIVDSSSSRLAVQLTTSDDVIINHLLKNKYCPLSELYPKLPEAGKVTRGVLTDVNTEGVISLQLAGVGVAKLKEIEQQINSLCNTKGASGCSFVKKMNVGLKCVAKCNDNKYYRAEVTKILSVTEVEVNLVDYGKVVTVEKLKLKTISDGSVWSLPYQAITCCLDNLPPPKGNWTPEASEFLKQKCSDEVTIESTETTGSVKLYLQNSDDEEDLNETLQSSPHLFGLPCEHQNDGGDGDGKQSSSGCHGNSTPGSDQLNSNRNSNVLSYQPLASSDYDDNDDKTIESSVAMQPDTFQIVKVTHVSTTTNEFTVQLSSYEAVMEKLTQQLQEYCNNIPSSFATINDLLNTQHQYCAVKHNGQWYRAKLAAIKGQDILVTLLDYGPNIVTNITCLHHLHHSMVAIPAQAVTAIHYLSLKEGVARPSAIVPGNHYHCFPYFRSNQCYVVSLVDYETNALLQPSS